MNALTLKSRIDNDGHLRVDIPIGLPPGPVDLVLVVQPHATKETHDIRELRGLGEENWEGIDAQEYVRTLRSEWRS